MKTLLLALLLLIICSTSLAQYAYNKPDAIYLLFQPTDLGIGVRYDYHIKDLGLYSSISYGDWRLYKYNGLRHHVKLSTGVLLPFRTSSNNSHSDFTAGINYHHIGSIMFDDVYLDPKIFNPWSFELGFVTKFRFFSVAVATDILRWEPCVYIGKTLNYKKFYIK